MIQAISGDSPVKAVKKMRVDHGEVVRDWDGRGSPGNRRIVTRSNQTEELLALDEEEPEGQVMQEVEEEVLRVEVVNEDGSMHEVGVDEELQQDGWEDESATEEDVYDATLMHMGEAAAHEATIQSAEDIREDQPEPVEAAIDQSAPIVEEVGRESETLQNEDPMPREVGTTGTGALGIARSLLSSQQPVLPEGFVSPVKERRRRPISQVKQAHANRRRTLPVDFSAAQAAASKVQDVEKAGDAQIQVEDDQAPQEDLATQESNSEPPHDETPAENEWEDVEEENNSTNPVPVAESFGQTEWVDTVENTPTTSPAKEPAVNQSLAAQVHERVADLVSPSKLPSSPVPSITGQHPRLPLRRSPRRQSTSPMKKSSILPSDRSHLIAFTPVKFQVYQSTDLEPRLASSPLPTSPFLPQVKDSPQMGMPQITRSSSAPPEEPQMSPRKPGQPRLSDDTALLQAFINRASESKNGRRISATARRESLENRRNSDVVRQALASPAVKPAVADVLGDLDPNSPSPRKQAAVEVDTGPSQQDDQDELSQSPPAKAASRRSGRAKKKPETLPATTYSGPNKISIRGSSDPVVLKKTEAQEIAQTTRNNTRKNKGGAVLPPLRLTRMAKEASLNGGEEASEAPAEVDANRRGIKWAETLATFYEGAAEPEISMMIDELGDPEPGDDTATLDIDMTNMSAPTPASETPSKPRQRRLKPTRTASTPAKAAPSASKEQEVEPPKDSKPKATTKKRSRIATPAKPKGGTVVAEPLKEEVKEEPQKASTAKKKAVSKLPAPTTSAIPAAQGKENSVIASPPKKRTKAPSAAPSTAKNPQVKLDFSKAVGLDKKQADNSAVPGIASPAKRSARTNVLFGEDGSVTKKELPPSLGSPAKKRTRRTPA